jgi:hypothetical protein
MPLFFPFHSPMPHACFSLSPILLFSKLFHNFTRNS